MNANAPFLGDWGITSEQYGEFEKLRKKINDLYTDFYKGYTGEAREEHSAFLRYLIHNGTIKQSDMDDLYRSCGKREVDYKKMLIPGLYLQKNNSTECESYERIRNLMKYKIQKLWQSKLNDLKRKKKNQNDLELKYKTQDRVYEELDKHRRQIEKDDCSEELKLDYNKLVDTDYIPTNYENFVKRVQKIEQRIFKLDKTIKKFTIFIHHMNKIARQLNSDEILFEKKHGITILLDNISETVKSTEILKDFNAPDGYFDILIDKAKQQGKKRVFISLLMKIGDDRDGHANLLVLEIDPTGFNHQVFRYEPNLYSGNEIYYNESISLKGVDDYLREYFKKYKNISYAGFPENSCSVKHGGLCRYVGFAQFIFGKNISYFRLKLFILKYLYDIVSDYCSLDERNSFGKRKQMTLKQVNNLLNLLKTV